MRLDKNRNEGNQMKRIVRGAALGAIVACGLFGQGAPAPLTFEVASIKPSAPDARGTMLQIQPGGGLRVTNATLRMLITQAYDVRDFQVSGGPGWINSERYDITARSEHLAGADNLPDDLRKMTDEQRKTVGEQMRVRLLALLADRFQLKIHRETKEQPVYALVVGKNGPKFQEAKEGAANRGRMRMGRGQLTGEGVQIQFLTVALSNQVGRPVLDRTGLKGNYDFKLDWTPEPGQGGGPFGTPPPGVDAPPPPDPNGPSLFTAIQEQLGLRLESQKGPVDMIVIDSVEKASEN